MRLSPADHREAAGLVQIGSDLGEELVVAQTDRRRDPDVLLDLSDQSRDALGGRRRVGRFSLVEVQEGLVDREGLDQGRHAAHEFTDLPPDGGIFGPVGRQHDGFRASLQRLEHGHRGANAETARDVARRHDDAPMPTADDDGPVGQTGIVAFLDRGIEAVAVDVNDGEFVQFGVGDRSFGTAGRAPTRWTGVEDRGAVTAQSRHALNRRWISPAAAADSAPCNPFARERSLAAAIVRGVRSTVPEPLDAPANVRQRWPAGFRARPHGDHASFGVRISMR